MILVLGFWGELILVPMSVLEVELCVGERIEVADFVEVEELPRR